MLNTVVTGAAGAGPPLIIAHGLFGSARNWGRVAKQLGDARQVIAVDMRNHGESFHTAAHDYPALAEDLAGVAGAQGGAVDVLGHSMGGKAAMVLALTRPEALRRLIVADIAPVAYPHDQMEYVRAMQGLDLAGVTRRSEADARLAETIPDPGVRGFLLQSLDLKAEPPRWRLNLDALADRMDLLVGWPEIEGRFDGPALFLSGQRSDYVRRSHRARITELFPNARFAAIKDAGHWLHADKPDETAGTVRAFLDA